LVAPGASSTLGGPLGPLLTLGCYKVSASSVCEVVLSALRAGFRRVDTAASYANEEGVGRALASCGLPRAQIHVTTKLAWTDMSGSAEECYAAALQSLRRLAVSYVDLFLLHFPGRAKTQHSSPLHATARLAAWRALERLQAEGRARRIGVSNFETRHLAPLLAPGVAKVKPAVNQVEMHPLLFDTQRELAAYCADKGIQIEAYMPLGGGHKALLQHPQVASIARALSSKVGPSGTLGTIRTPAEVLLRWSVQHGFLPVVKAASHAHQRTNIAVVGANAHDATATPPFTLTEEQMRTLDELGAGKEVKRFAWNPQQFS
jgi:diketogulonate reductase-like aldo/keto reductase